MDEGDWELEKEVGRMKYKEGKKTEWDKNQRFKQ
jgi:hypothetical protein